MGRGTTRANVRPGDDRPAGDDREAGAELGLPVPQRGCQPPEGSLVEGAQVDLPAVMPVPRRHYARSGASLPVRQVARGLPSYEIIQGVVLRRDQ